MKASVIKCSVLFLLVFLLSIGNSALALDKTSVNLIKSYKEALSANNPEAIRKAFEALKANTEAVTYMNKNLPNLYERYEQSKALAASEKAKLAKGQRPGARSTSGSQPPAKTKIDPGAQQAKARAKAAAGAAKSSPGAGVGERPNIQDILNRGRGVVDPKKAGVEMPGRVSQDKSPPRRVSGDPELAELAKPGQKAVSGPKGDPDLAELVKGKGGAQPSSSSPKTKFTGDTKVSGDPGKTRLSGSGADTKYTGNTKVSGDPGKTRVSGQPKQNIGSRRVSGDPNLAKLAKPGQEVVQGPKGDPDLAKLAKGQQSRARSNFGSEPPAKTKIDPDPVRRAVREGRDAVRGGKSPAKTKIDPGAPPRRVSGDPELAELAKPGQKAVSGPKGDPDLAELVKGKGGAQPSSSSPKTKFTGDTKVSGDPGKTRLSGSGADTKYTGNTKVSGDPGKTRVSGQPKQNIGSRRVSGDPNLAKLAKPGQEVVQGPKGDPDLAKLAKGQQSGARSNFGSEPPAKTKIDPDPVRRAVREGRDAVRGGKSPAKTKIDRGAPPRRVSGDPELAELAKPGQRAVSGPKGDPDLAKLAKGQQSGARSNFGSEPPAKTKIDPDPVRRAVREGRDAVRGGKSPAKTKIDPGAPPRRVSGDPELAELAKPGQKAVSGPKGDPGLAKLAGKGKVYGREATAETVAGKGKVYGKEATAETVAGKGSKSSPKSPQEVAEWVRARGGNETPTMVDESIPGRTVKDTTASKSSPKSPQEVAEWVRARGGNETPTMVDESIPGRTVKDTTASKSSPKSPQEVAEWVRARGGNETPTMVDESIPGRTVKDTTASKSSPKSPQEVAEWVRARGGNETPTMVDESIPGRTVKDTTASKSSPKSPQEVAEWVRARGGNETPTMVDESIPGRTVIDKAGGKGGKPSASLLDGGKASAQQTPLGKARSQIQAAETRLGQLAEADIARANQVANKAGVTITSELAADAGMLRRGVNATGKAAMGGLAVAGAAYEGGTIGYGAGKTMVNLKDAYYEEDEEMRDHLIERAKEEAADTAEHAALTTVVVGATLAAPATAGSAMAGAAGYGAGRLVLENTETGRAVDKSVQDGMTDFLTDLDDVARHASGKKTRSTINRETLSRRQQIWLDTLERGDIKLQEGATVEDFLTLVQRQHDDGKISKLDNLGALGDAVVKVDKTQTTQQIREDTTFRDPDMEGEAEEVAGAILRDDPKEIDDLARAMVDNQVTAQEQAQWKDQGAADPNSLAGEAVRGFTGTNSAGHTDTERDMHASTRVTWTPDEVKKKDIEEERRKAKEQERQADAQRANQQRIDETRFTNDWRGTIGAINESLAELNEQDAQKVKVMTEATIELIKQMQNGTLSDEDFTNQMAALENEHANLQQEGLEGWRRIRDGLIGDQATPGGGSGNIPVGGNEADPCINDFTMNNNSELSCKCQGYTFDYSRARCVKTGGGSGTASTGGTGGTSGSGNICPCVDENGRRYRVMFGQDCSMDLGMAGRDYNCSDDTIGGGGSATRTGGSGGGATGRKGMMYRVHQPPYGGGDICLTAEEAAEIRKAPNTVLFEPLGETCFK